MLQVSLQVHGIDLEDEDIFEGIGSDLTDLLWEDTLGLITATLYYDGDDDVVSYAVDVARQIEHQLPGAKVKRVHEELVNQSEIAARAGVSRQAVSKWVTRVGETAFPEPMTVLADRQSNRLWSWAHVSRWLTENYALDSGEQFPSDQEVAAINAHLAGVTSTADDILSQWASMRQTRRPWTSPFGDLFTPELPVRYAPRPQPSHGVRTGVARREAARRWKLNAA